jgi:beta-xylosidase
MSYPEKQSFKTYEETKVIQDKNKLKEFMKTKPVLEKYSQWTTV